MRRKSQGTLRSAYAILLRACYAMSGTVIAYAAPTSVLCDVRTDIAYGTVCLRVSGTDLEYDRIPLCACYAMSGTDLAYDATRIRAQTEGGGWT
eukprot:3940481-Rhodomonas_salina.9